MLRFLRENDKFERKWRENEEMGRDNGERMRKWRERAKMARESENGEEIERE